MTQKTIARLCLTALVVMAAACGPIVELPNSGPAPALYTLTPPSGSSGDRTTELLLVEDFTAVAGLDSTLLARRASPTMIEYYSGGRWADRPTVMLKAGLIEGFELVNQHVTRGRGGTSVPAAFELQSDVRDFQAEFYSGGLTPEVRVRLSLTLVRLGPLKTVGNTTIEVTSRAFGPTLNDVVLAFDEAADKAMQQTVTWTIEQIRAQE